MKRLSIIKMVLILIIGISFYFNNHFENLSRLEGSMGMYTDTYMNGAPFLIIGFASIFALFVLEVVSYKNVKKN